MSWNVFDWIRSGVKQSVLLGFSDALEEVGTPPDGEDVGPAMSGVLEQAARGKKSGTTRRKRLGRSLKDLNPVEGDPKAK